MHVAGHEEAYTQQSFRRLRPRRNYVRREIVTTGASPAAQAGFEIPGPRVRLAFPFVPKILVVDDEPAVLRLVREFLVRAGHHVTAVSSPAAAMEACRSASFDVLLSDVRMPGLDGHELARWVAVNYPATRTVLMSGYDLQCQGCPYSPRCALVNKPFGYAGIVQAVERALAQPVNPGENG
jgi:two-component system, cell cycle response regulator CpdR